MTTKGTYLEVKHKHSMSNLSEQNKGVLAAELTVKFYKTMQNITHIMKLQQGKKRLDLLSYNWALKIYWKAWYLQIVVANFYSVKQLREQLIPELLWFCPGNNCDL